MYNHFHQYSSPQFEFRPFQPSDYHLGVFDLLAQLTKAPLPPFEDYHKFLEAMNSSHNKHIHIVGVDKKENRIIAFGSVIITNSIKDGKVGKIENIVTCKKVRGKGLGRIIILILKEEGWKEGCSKIGLFCEEHNVKFYEKLDFKLKGQIFAYYKP